MSEYGLALYNVNGFKQIDTNILAYKTFILNSTHSLSVAQSQQSYPYAMDFYGKSTNAVLNQITPQNLIMVRPSSAAMLPVTVGLAVFNEPTAGIDIYVRANQAGSLEFRQYVATGDADYNTLIAGLPSPPRYGIQARNENDEVVFDTDVSLPRIQAAIKATAGEGGGAISSYTGSIPFVSLNSSTVSVTYPDTLTTEANTDIFVEVYCARFTSTGAGYKSDVVSNSGGADHQAEFSPTFLVMKE